MTEHLETPCWSSNHLRYISFLGVPMAIIYVLGLPSFLFVLLHTNRHLIKDNTSTAVARPTLVPETDRSEDFFLKQNSDGFHTKYAFLYDGYRKEAIWWEGVILIRKVLLTIVAVFLVYNRRTQALLGLLVLFLALGAQLHTRPFQMDQMNSLEVIACSCAQLAITADASIFCVRLSRCVIQL